MRAVNLLPEDAHGGKRWLAADDGRASGKRVLMGAGAAAGVVAAAFAGMFVHERGAVSAKRGKLDGLQQKLAAAQATAAATQAARSSAEARLAAVVTVAQQRLAWQKLLRDLSRVLPTDVSLQSLQATAVASTTATGSTTGASAPTAFTVNGFTSSQYGVALVLDRLALLPWLSDVTLQQSGGGESGKGSAVQFTIGANLRSRGGQ